MEATSTIPIVMVTTSDAVETGLVTSLSHPGFGPVPAATLNFKEDPEKTAAALKRAKEVLQLQR